MNGQYRKVGEGPAPGGLHDRRAAGERGFKADPHEDDLFVRIPLSKRKALRSGIDHPNLSAVGAFLLE